MKKIKQILALCGVVLLIALYAATLILAITDQTGSMQMFFASVIATVIIPVLLWAYTFIYKLIHKDSPDASSADENDKKNGN